MPGGLHLVRTGSSCSPAYTDGAGSTLRSSGADAGLRHRLHRPSSNRRTAGSGLRLVDRHGWRPEYLPDPRRDGRRRIVAGKWRALHLAQSPGDERSPKGLRGQGGTLGPALLRLLRLTVGLSHSKQWAIGPSGGSGVRGRVKKTIRFDRLGVFVAIVLIASGVSSALPPTAATADDRGAGFASQLSYREETKSTNAAGCIRTVVPLPHGDNRLQTSFVSAILFARPRGLDVERLSDGELIGCGLRPQRVVRNLPRASKGYRDWLSEVRAELVARQPSRIDLAGPTPVMRPRGSLPPPTPPPLRRPSPE